MANETKAPAAAAPSASKAPAMPAPKGDAVKNGDPKGAVQAGDKEAKEKKPNWKDLPSVFNTEAEAVKAAAERTNGPRRAFKVEFNGKVYWVVSHNYMCVGTPLALHLGMVATEIGKAPRAPKAVTAESLLDGLAALPAEEQAKIKAKMKELLGS